MTGKKNKLRRVNCLSISRGWDGVWRVRSPERPHRVLYEAPSQEKAYRWAHRHREFTQRTPIWTEEELLYLDDNYGVLPAERICRHLGRSRNALKIAAYRKLNHINQRSNIYTAREVARIVGVG